MDIAHVGLSADLLRHAQQLRLAERELVARAARARWAQILSFSFH